MSAVAGAGRVRAQPPPSLLGVRFTEAPPGITVVPAQPLPRRTAGEVASWFEDLAPLAFDRDVLRALPGDEVARDLLGGPNPLPVSAVYREREGGRRYAYMVPSWTGPRLLTEREHATLGPRRLLQGIPRSLRSAFGAPAGCRFVLADLRHCFLVLLGTAADDQTLLAAATRDLHQETGDAMAPHLPEGERRDLGKRFHSAVVGLVTAEGWYADLRRRGLTVTRAQAHAMYAGWWSRFPAARRLADRWVAMHRQAAVRGRPLRLVYPDGRSYTYDVATVRGSAPRPAWAHLSQPADRLAASIRTSFSAIWRGIEGVILDEALERVHALRPRGLRLVLPMYDGLLLAAPVAAASELAGLVEVAMHQALTAVGVPGQASVRLASTWGGCGDDVMPVGS